MKFTVEEFDCGVYAVIVMGEEYCVVVDYEDRRDAKERAEHIAEALNAWEEAYEDPMDTYRVNHAL